MSMGHLSKFSHHYVTTLREVIDAGVVTLPGIAKVFGTNTATLRRWRQNEPRFERAWREGLNEARAEALGYLVTRELTPDQRAFCRDLARQCQAELKARFGLAV